MQYVQRMEIVIPDGTISKFHWVGPPLSAKWVTGPHSFDTFSRYS